MIQDRKDLPSLLQPDWYCVEIGVHLGDYSHHILQNSQCRFLASVDPWEPCPNIIETLEDGDRYYDYTIQKLRIFGDRSYVYRMTGQRFHKLIDSLQPNFVYIDSTHTYDETKEQLELWWPSIAPGGILAGHDYINGPCVKRAVDEFVAANAIVLETTVNDDGWPHPVNSWYIKKP